MTTMTAPHHQVASATAHMRGVVDGVVDASVWSMTAAEAASTLVELARLKSQIVELEARVAAHADVVQVGTEVGATSTANWLAHRTRQTRAAAAGVVHFGYDLGTYDRVRAGLATGDLRVRPGRPPRQQGRVRRAGGCGPPPASRPPEPRWLRASKPPSTDNAAGCE